jgi:outer membrane immunogenic protein
MAIAPTFARGLAAGALLVSAGSALAAEPFNGPYIGAQAGWQQDRNRLTSIDDEGVRSSVSDRSSSFAYGAQLGYDAKVAEQFVLGAEAFIIGDTNKARAGNVTFDGGRALGLLARAGVLASPRTLLYGTGGWENGRFTYAVSGIGVSTNRDGWTLGGGIEQMLTDNVSARVEYRHTKFNSFNSDALDAATGADSSARVNRNRVMLGVNYRF